MRIDNLDIETGRYDVIDVETGEEIENIAWADDDKGECYVFRTRGRTLADAPGADLRLGDGSGSFKVKIHEGGIKIVDLSENSFKVDLLTLLRDPDVAAAVVHLIVDVKRRNPALFK